VPAKSRGLHSISLASKHDNKSEYIPRDKRLNEILAQLPKRGKLFRWNRAGMGSLHRLMCQATQKAGIAHHGRSFYMFRKGKWTHLIRSGFNPVVTSQYMRCRMVTAKKHYIAQDLGDMEEAANACYYAQFQHSSFYAFRYNPCTACDPGRA
jgi:hypothetical protein